MGLKNVLLVILILFCFSGFCQNEAIDENWYENIDLINVCDPSILNSHLSNYVDRLNKEDLADLDKDLSLKIQNCENQHLLNVIKDHLIFVYYKEKINHSYYQEEATLKKHEAALKNLDASEKILFDYDQLLYGLHTHFVSLYHRNGNHTKAGKYSFLSLGKENDYEYYNSIVQTIPYRLKSNLNDKLLQDILACRENYYNLYLEGHGRFYYDKMNLHLAEFYCNSGSTDLCFDYLEISKDKQALLKFNWLRILASYHRKNANFDLEEKTLLQVLNFIPKRQKTPALIQLADFYLNQNKLSKSKEFYSQALEETLERTDETPVILKHTSHINCLIGLSKINLLNNEAFQETKGMLQNARVLLGEQFNSLGAQRDKLKMLESYSILFKLIFKYRDELEFSLQNLLEFSEEAKGFALLDELNEGKRIEKSLNESEYQLYNNTQVYLAETNIKMKREKLDRNSRTKHLMDRTRFQETIDSLKVLAGESSIQVFDFSKCDSISEEKSIVEFYLTDSLGIAFLINDGDIKIFELDINQSLLDEITNFKSLISNKKSQLDIVNNLSHSIFTSLLGKFHADFKKDIIIIPHGPISSIPFEALVTNDGDYLVENHSISYAYSLSVLKQMQSQGKGGSRLLGFAPNYNNYDNVFNLTVLGNNKKELNLIEEVIPNAKCFYANEAKKDSFKMYAGEYDIIHIAGHADVNPLDDDLSYIAFSDSSRTKESTVLYLSNLYATDLKAEMIVLSACNTGLGTYKSGEGILSLARGFVHAGTASVVSSLWEVNDKSTMSIMNNFYSRLKKGHPKDQALTWAKRAYLNENEKNRHPFYWAGSVLIGDSASFPRMRTYPWHIVLTMLLAFFVMFFLFRKLRSDT